MKELKLKFTKALITGATSGIGEALAHILAAKGIDLILTGRNKARLQKLGNKLKKHVHVLEVPADLIIDEQRQKLIDIIHKETPNLIINNAGFGLYGEALSYETKEQLEILDLNAKVPLEISLEGARSLVSKAKRGVIVNISSVAAFIPFPTFAVYSASKTFINHFSQAFDSEMKGYGIRILSSCPGRVATNFSARAAGASFLDTNNKTKMSPSYAAQEIWSQIESLQPVKVFNWKYRLVPYLAKILPKSLIAKILEKNLKQYYPPREIIKFDPTDESLTKNQPF